MKKIIGILRPFELVQNFYVYEDGNKIDFAEINVDDINNTILRFSEEYEIYNVELTGPKKYAQGIKKQLEEAEMSKYSENKLKIDLV